MKTKKKPTWCEHWEEEFKTVEDRNAFCKSCARAAQAADLFAREAVEEQCEALDNWNAPEELEAVEATDEPAQEPAPTQTAWPQACDQLGLF